MTEGTASAEQRVTEVLLRYADDAPALRRLQSVILWACLAAIDHQAALTAR